MEHIRSLNTVRDNTCQGLPPRTVPSSQAQRNKIEIYQLLAIEFKLNRIE